MSIHRTRNMVPRSALAAAVASVAIFTTLDPADAAGRRTIEVLCLCPPGPATEPGPVLAAPTTPPSTDVVDLEYEYVLNGSSVTTWSEQAKSDTSVATETLVITYEELTVEGG